MGQFIVFTSEDKGPNQSEQLKKSRPMKDEGLLNRNFLLSPHSPESAACRGQLLSWRRKPLGPVGGQANRCTLIQPHVQVV